MEVALIVFLIFPAYILVRLALGHHMTAMDKDRRRFKQGIELFNKKEYQAALGYFSRIVNEQGERAVALQYLGACYFFLGKPYRAIAKATRALELEPTLALSYYIKGRVLYDEGHLEQALRELDKAVWYDKAYAEAYYWKGHVLKDLKRSPEALRSFEIARDHGDEQANFHLLQHHLVKK